MLLKVPGSTLGVVEGTNGCFKQSFEKIVIFGGMILWLSTVVYKIETSLHTGSMLELISDWFVGSV